MSFSDLYVAYVDSTASAAKTRFARYTSAAWTEKASGTDPTARTARLRHFGSGLLIHARTQFAANGDIEVSTDSGETWTTIAAPAGANGRPLHIERAIDGRLWMLANDSTTSELRVYYSDDSGATWTLSLTKAIATGVAYSITCHPTDTNHIAVGWVTGSVVPRIEFTLDRGASWGFVAPTTPLLGVTFYIKLLQTGRLLAIVGRSGPNGIRVVYSDDEGLNWTQIYSTSGYSSLQWTSIIQEGNSGTKTVVLSNEQQEPLIGVTVEAYDAATPTSVIEKAVTNRVGVAVFRSLPSVTVQPYLFRPRITRSAGGPAEANGKVNLQIVESFVKDGARQAGPIFLIAADLGANAQLLRSLDMGASVSQIGAMPLATTPTGYAGAAYDRATDALYLTTYDDGVLFRLANASFRTDWTTLAISEWTNLGVVVASSDIATTTADVLVPMVG